MKKALCFMLVFVSLLAIVGCSQNQADRNPILGSWEMETKMSVLGVSIPDDEGNQTVDGIYRLEFNEDGTGKNSIIIDEKDADRIPNTNVNFTYTQDGNKLEFIREDGNIQVFTVSFSGDKLILDGRARLELIRKK